MEEIEAGGPSAFCRKIPSSAWTRTRRRPWPAAPTDTPCWRRSRCGRRAGADAGGGGGTGAAGRTCVRRLAQLAFGRVNDAARLALHSGEADLETLDLSAVAELKVTDKGGVEIKLMDRIRALEALCGLLERGEGGGRRRSCTGRWRTPPGRKERGTTAEIMRFSPKQRQGADLVVPPGNWEAIICDGAVRSGKTFSMGLSFFLWAHGRFDGQAVRAVRQDHRLPAAEPAGGAGALSAAAGLRLPGAAVGEPADRAAGGAGRTASCSSAGGTSPARP